MLRTTLIILLTAALTACATKRYGRMLPLTETEAQAYDCDDIAVEMAKIDAFNADIDQKKKFNLKSAAGILGDLGIGNKAEKDEARKSAKKRDRELENLSASKGCGVHVK